MHNYITRNKCYTVHVSIETFFFKVSAHLTSFFSDNSLGRCFTLNYIALSSARCCFCRWNWFCLIFNTRTTNIAKWRIHFKITNFSLSVFNVKDFHLHPVHNSCIFIGENLFIATMERIPNKVTNLNIFCCYRLQ